MGARLLGICLRLVAPLGMITGVATFAASAQSPPVHVEATYWVYVANESSDLVSRVRFGPDGIVEEKTIPVGIHPADLDGAHGISVSPSGDHWYVSIAHGTPYGMIWKFETDTDRFVDSTTVGLFPATMAVSPDGGSLFVVNFNLHGDPEPSSVSAVFTPFMSEMRKIETCVMPHGSGITLDGTRHYSTCMMSDQLVEIATDRLEVSRRLSLTRNSEHVLAANQTGTHVMGEGVCKPTWVTVSVDQTRVYVPCNGRNEVLEIDRSSLKIARTFPTGRAPYNAAASPDGRWLVVTLKGEQAVTMIDLHTGEQTRIPTTQPVTHGVVVTPDARFAFVSNESVGATKGTVDVIDLSSQSRVASVTLQHQPGGIGFWKMDSASAKTP